MTKASIATGSLHLETPNWWYAFAECAIIMSSKHKGAKHHDTW